MYNLVKGKKLHINSSINKGRKCQYYRLDSYGIDLDIQIENILEAISEIFQEIEPSMYIENDGIGSYEYWGSMGFDSGTDYLTTGGNEYEDIIFEIELMDDKPNVDYMRLLKALKGKLFTKSFYKIISEYDDTIEAEFHVHSYPSIKWDMNDKMIIELKLEWCDCE